MNESFYKNVNYFFQFGDFLARKVFVAQTELNFPAKINSGGNSLSLKRSCVFYTKIYSAKTRFRSNGVVFFGLLIWGRKTRFRSNGVVFFGLLIWGRKTRFRSNKKSILIVSSDYIECKFNWDYPESLISRGFSE